MGAGDVAHDGQSEPCAAGLAAPGLIDAVEALEDPLEVPGGDPDAPVGHRDDRVIPTADLDGDGRVAVGVLDRVLQQVGDGGNELRRITGGPHDVGANHVDVDAVPF